MDKPSESDRLVARLRFRHLNLLTEVQARGSLRAAAESLNLTQPALSKALAQWVLQQAGVRVAYVELPNAVRVSSATARSGEKLHFFTNWSWDEQRLPTALNGIDLISGVPVSTGDAPTLAAWETRIFVTA